MNKEQPGQSWEKCKHSIGYIAEGGHRFVNKLNEMGMYETYACKLDLHFYPVASLSSSSASIIYSLEDANPSELAQEKKAFGEEDALKRRIEMGTAPCTHCKYFEPKKKKPWYKFW